MSSKLTESFAKKAKDKVSSLTNYAIWLFIALLAVSVLRNIGKVKRIREEIAAEKQRIAKIEAENKNLERQVALTMSPQFVEKEIRNKLGLVKTGEVVVVLPDADILRKLAPEAKIVQDDLPLPIWEKWLRLFVQSSS